jgi:uncharacterized protein YbgA (DUF1722 family)/uncharacterized protein YbbK (DUF523 family)
MTNNIVIGISACLVGEKVRYDGGSKKSNFCVAELGQYVSYKPFCPEVAVGLPVPRPTIRQIKKQDLIHVARPDGSGDVTEALKAYGQKVAKLAQSFSGYVFCAKSPTCGMERVKVYNANGDALTADGIGVFADEIMKANPLLPCEENGRLNDASIRENFVARVFVYKNWQQLCQSGITKHKLFEFHSQYKYMVMSHDLVAYKTLGRLLGGAQLPLEELACQYIAGLMAALTKIASRKNHTNTLQHIQGYFSKQLAANEKQELCQQIDDYRMGLVPLVVPLTLIKHYLMHYPQAYIAQQVYLNPYPHQLKLRYGY